MSCSICLEAFKEPVALPCGHIFCHPCAVDTIRHKGIGGDWSYRCAMCRSPYSILSVDPSVLPPPLRLHVLPALRRVYLPPLVSDGKATALLSNAYAIAKRDNTQLRAHADAWRRRAEIHAGALMGLAGAARSLVKERDALKAECVALKEEASRAQKRGAEFEEKPSKRKRVSEETACAPVPKSAASPVRRSRRSVSRRAVAVGC